MKLFSNVIMAFDGNYNYSKYWKYASRAWQEGIGVNPILLVITEKGQEVKIEDTGYGKIIYDHFLDFSICPKFMQICLMRMWYMLKMDGVNIMADLDAIPLSKRRLVDEVPDEGNEPFYWLYAGFYGKYNQKISWFHASSAVTYAKIFGVDINCTFEEFVKRAFELTSEYTELPKGQYGVPYWALDEVLLTKLTVWNKPESLKVVDIQVPQAKGPGASSYLWVTKKEKFRESWMRTGHYVHAHKYNPNDDNLRNQLEYMLNLAFGFGYELPENYVNPNQVKAR